jgi:hypothetical protein
MLGAVNHPALTCTLRQLCMLVVVFRRGRTGRLHYKECRSWGSMYRCQRTTTGQCRQQQVHVRLCLPSSAKQCSDAATSGALWRCARLGGFPPQIQTCGLVLHSLFTYWGLHAAGAMLPGSSRTQDTGTALGAHGKWQHICGCWLLKQTQSVFNKLSQVESVPSAVREQELQLTCPAALKAPSPTSKLFHWIRVGQSFGNVRPLVCTKKLARMAEGL